ncbi:unnamed protein product [Durusdinium trenchii]|uniref:Uncharacterized protein n=1 Tax=Durusdinium trenchii TaxID=1381693 RepID=A0ABP0P338_9DINO
MPEYTKACSVSVELMKELSPDGFELLKRFTDAVENKLWDQLDVFQQSISQLRNLNKKYMSVKSCAVDWKMEHVLWMFQGDETVDSDMTMMLELRTEISDSIKCADKILAVGRGPSSFEKFAEELKKTTVDAQAKCL